MSIENRSVKLYCPVCGNDYYLSLDNEINNISEATDDTRIQCTDCKSVFTKAELMEANQDIINANIEEVEQEMVKEIENRIKKIFR